MTPKKNIENGHSMCCGAAPERQSSRILKQNRICSQCKYHRIEYLGETRNEEFYTYPENVCTYDAHWLGVRNFNNVYGWEKEIFPLDFYGIRFSPGNKIVRKLLCSEFRKGPRNAYYSEDGRYRFIEKTCGQEGRFFEQATEEEIQKFNRPLIPSIPSRILDFISYVFSSDDTFTGFFLLFILILVLVSAMLS